jgi:valyl-tRNA synthetase
MKVRLDHWIEGLKYDWNISRQRFYGVPFPVWYCESCGEAILADEATLPVDPVEDACPVSACPKCGSADIKGEPDVMDTWMTSSLTPLINANWAGSPGRKGAMDLHPMTVRVQAFEIIRTWLFYTLIKSDAHLDTLPWRDVMISGWGLNENGKKISKSDLEKYTDKDGYNRYEPFGVIRKFGADALRFWAAGSHLGQDMRFNEKDVKDGRKLAVKLWNAARFVLMQIEGFDPDAPRPAFADRQPEDRWLLTELNKILPGVAAGMEGFDYAVAREAIERFFWATFCDDYLEMVKHRFWKPELYSEDDPGAVRPVRPVHHGGPVPADLPPGGRRAFAARDGVAGPRCLAHGRGARDGGGQRDPAGGAAAPYGVAALPDARARGGGPGSPHGQRRAEDRRARDEGVHSGRRPRG